MNKLHPKIKFEEKISSNSIDFLDLTIFKGRRYFTEGTLDFKVYSKPNNQFLYTPFTSFHPRHVKIAFIYGELTRYVRNCSNESDFLKLRELFASRLRDRGFPKSCIINSFKKVSYKDRMQLLYSSKKASKHKNTPLVFSLPFDAYSSRLKVKNILTEHWHLLTNDPVHKRIFNDQPIVSYSRSRNLGEVLVIANRKFRKSAPSVLVTDRAGLFSLYPPLLLPALSIFLFISLT